ncbi:MAG: hypothetical protein HY330_05720 [Chloroflexi bacterium]|nr:hypothetical protein [Chloroflexota bacterium]
MTSIQSDKQRLPLRSGKTWTEVRRVRGLIVAEMWKDLFEGEGVPTRLLPVPGDAETGEFALYGIMVPTEKFHVVEEILRKA